MRLRSNCKCECHQKEHITLHETPCCIENPSLEKDWEILKKSLIENGIPETTTGLMKYVFYLGAFRTMSYIKLTQILEPNCTIQLINNLFEETNFFVEKYFEK